MMVNIWSWLQFQVIKNISRFFFLVAVFYAWLTMQMKIFQQVNIKLTLKTSGLIFFSFFTQNIGKVFYITRALSSEVQLQTLFHELLINYNLQFQSQSFYSNIHYCATSTFDRTTINIAQLWDLPLCTM